MPVTASSAPSKMMKIRFLEGLDPAVKRDVLFIAKVVAVLTVLMEAVFLIIGQWDITVLFGGMLGAGAGLVNFVLMARGVQKAVERDTKEASGMMKTSQSLRMVMLLVIGVIAALLPNVFDLVSFLLPLLFPSVGARLYGRFNRS